MKEKNTVTLDLAKFDAIYRKSVKYDMLINLILRLTYDNPTTGEIEVDGDDALELVSVLEPDVCDLYMKERWHK